MEIFMLIVSIMGFTSMIIALIVLVLLINDKNKIIENLTNANQEYIELLLEINDQMIKDEQNYQERRDNFHNIIGQMYDENS